MENSIRCGNESTCMPADGLSEIESAGGKLMEAISINASLVCEAKAVIIDPSKPVEANGGKDIAEGPRTVTDFIANMTRQVLAANDELREINAVLYRTLGSRVHLG